MVSLVNKKLQKCAHFIYQSMKTAFVQVFFMSDSELG